MSLLWQRISNKALQKNCNNERGVGEVEWGCAYVGSIPASAPEKDCLT